MRLARPLPSAPAAALLALVASPLPAPAQPVPPSLVSTGDVNCDEAVSAWRACIAASPRNPQDKATANGDVDRFAREVFAARGTHRDELVRACAPTNAGYRAMLQAGTCAGNITGAQDNARASVAPAPVIFQRRR